MNRTPSRRPRPPELQYIDGRWYDRELGRFINEAPDGLASGDINLYRFEYNGPYNHTRQPPPSGGLFAGIIDGIANFFDAANRLSQDVPEYGDIISRVMNVDPRGAGGQTSIVSARTAWFDPGFRERIGAASTVIGGLVEFGATWTYGGLGLEAIGAARAMASAARISQGMARVGAMRTVAMESVHAARGARLQFDLMAAQAVRQAAARSGTAGGRVSSKADNFVSTGTRRADDALRRAPT